MMIESTDDNGRKAKKWSENNWWYFNKVRLKDLKLTDDNEKKLSKSDRIYKDW